MIIKIPRASQILLLWYNICNHSMPLEGILHFKRCIAFKRWFQNSTLKIISPSNLSSQGPENSRRDEGKCVRFRGVGRHQRNKSLYINRIVECMNSERLRQHDRACMGSLWSGSPKAKMGSGLIWGVLLYMYCLYWSINKAGLANGLAK